MDKNERIVHLEELRKLKEEVIKESLEKINNEESQEQSNTNAKVKKLGTGTVTGGLNMYPEYEETKAGMVNVITLSILSFIFEVLFIYLSILIFK